MKKVLFLLLFSFPAWSFQLTKDFMNGFYWTSLPISINVVESNSSRKATLEQLARDAVGEWEARTGLSLWSFNQGSTNIIRWSQNFAGETHMDPTTVLAVAIRYTNGPYFSKTEIVLNAGHPLNADLNHLLTTITHELGHTMGLDHSDNSQAVMAPTLQDPYRGLHNDDTQGMTHVYSETEHRQLTSYVSPLAYEKVESSEPMSCGTVGIVGSSSTNGLLSLGIGMLTAFIRKLLSWFKSLL